MQPDQAKLMLVKSAGRVLLDLMILVTEDAVFAADDVEAETLEQALAEPRSSSHHAPGVATRG